METTIEKLTAEARRANEAWTRAQLTGRRNSVAYKRAYTEKLAAARALLDAKLAMR